MYGVGCLSVGMGKYNVVNNFLHDLSSPLAKFW